jgi:hypothetical protein
MKIYLAALMLLSAPAFSAVSGSCHYGEQAICMNYTGKGWRDQRDQAKSDCEEDGGIFSNKTCARDRSFGKCAISLMKNFEMEAVFYPPNTEVTAREACDSLGGEYGLVN